MGGCFTKLLLDVQDVADVASTQVRTLELQHVSQEKENKSLRQQLLDFQVQSDEKTIIGMFHVVLFTFRMNAYYLQYPIEKYVLSFKQIQLLLL